MESMQKELLETLEAELKETDGIGELSVFTAEELNTQMDVLRAEIVGFGPDLVSVLGEFCFIPLEDDEIMYYSSVITISSELPKTVVTDVAAAVARLNYYLPCGSFCLGDHDKNLVYRHTVLLHSGDDIETLTRDISLASNTAIGVAERYVSYLLLVIKNEMTVEDMIKMMSAGPAQ